MTRIFPVSRTAGLLALAGTMGITALAFASDADVIKSRRALMKANADGAKAIGCMLKG